MNKTKLHMVKKLINFSTYTLLVPFLAVLIAFLNKVFGALCWDKTCEVHSEFLHIIFLLCLIGIGVFDIILLVKSNLKEKKALLPLVILNCVFCIYIFTLIQMGVWGILLIILPAIFTIPFHVLLWFLFFIKYVLKLDL